MSIGNPTATERRIALMPIDAIGMEIDNLIAERDALARQLAISRSLLMECVQNLSPPWQNPDHPLWSLKSRIKATFGGQSS